MLAEVVALESRDKEARPTTRVRSIRVGLIGLGNVGQAVARLAPDAHRLETCGVRFTIASALVRDVTRPRRCPKPARLTSNAEAFLRGHYDVVIEALGTIEPARTLVSRLLGRGVPVVTANKALVAAHGDDLRALAGRRGTALRFEASALAAVPFVGALTERPFVSEVSRFTAVVNGTSNFILSEMACDRRAFADALASAQRLGLTEPDPSRDVDGLDAADKFALLASIFGWGRYTPEAAEIRGIRELSGDDLEAAAALGGTIKPIVHARREASHVEAFVGPAFLPARHPLASLNGTLSGIQLSGRYVTDLFFSGPGAGPEVTAATILDDAVEAVGSARRFPKPSRSAVPPNPLRAPDTAWLVRVRFPGVAPEPAAAQTLLSAAGLHATACTSARLGAQWLLVAPCSAAHVTRALAHLRYTHRLECHAIRSAP